MKYIVWIIGGFILAGIWAGSFYVKPDLQYQTIYWVIKITISILSFIFVIWMWSKIHWDDYDWYTHNNQSEDDRCVFFIKLYWIPLLYILLIIVSQVLIWKSVSVHNEISQLSRIISDNIEFVWDWEPPHFYIGGKPQK